MGQEAVERRKLRLSNLTQFKKDDMPKRFTATDKWDDPWYRGMRSEHRDLWQFILDKCDNSGVWKKDIAVAEFYTGNKINENQVLTIFNNGKERVIVIDGGSMWLIVDFVAFQYGKLSTACKPHLEVSRLIKKHEMKGYPKGIHTLQEKDKDKDKEEGGVGETSAPVDNSLPSFETVYAPGTGKSVKVRKNADKGC